jgi:hypothetical protein
MRYYLVIRLFQLTNGKEDSVWLGESGDTIGLNCSADSEIEDLRNSYIGALRTLNLYLVLVYGRPGASRIHENSTYLSRRIERENEFYRAWGSYVGELMVTTGLGLGAYRLLGSFVRSPLMIKRFGSDDILLVKSLGRKADAALGVFIGSLVVSETQKQLKDNPALVPFIFSKDFIEHIFSQTQAKIDDLSVLEFLWMKEDYDRLSLIEAKKKVKKICPQCSNTLLIEKMKRLQRQILEIEYVVHGADPLNSYGRSKP